MALPAGRSELRLVVETSSGTFVRTIQPATPLAPSITQGRSAEAATESAAVKLGLPDFVFSAGLVSRGSGTREVGDRLVIVGSQGIVVQVKSRSDPGESQPREVNWLRKSIAKATRQASGTVRTLRGNPQSLSNLRGRQLNIKGANIEWAAVVILDHEDKSSDSSTALNRSAEMHSSFRWTERRSRSVPSRVVCSRRMVPTGRWASSVPGWKTLVLSKVCRFTGTTEWAIGPGRCTTSSFRSTPTQRTILHYRTLLDGPWHRGSFVRRSQPSRSVACGRLLGRCQFVTTVTRASERADSLMPSGNWAMSA